VSFLVILANNKQLFFIDLALAREYNRFYG